MPFISRNALSCVLAASLLAACGGGSGGSSSGSASTPPPTPTPTPSGNTPPVAVASSESSKVTQGGAFVVTASGSTDADGDSLTFTWAQTAGPLALQGVSTQDTTLNLTAPIVTQDTALTFEVTASDGTASTTDTVTVTAEPIAASATVRPGPPINTTLAALIGVTNEGDDQYRLYWTDGFSSSGNNIIASQIYSDAGAPVGGQLNGSFDLPQAGPTSSTQMNGLLPISVIENGGTTYAPLLYAYENAAPHLGSLVGPLVGNLSPVGDPEFAIGFDANFDQTPIGQNQIINVSSLNGGISASIRVDIFNPDGRVENVITAYSEIAPPGDPSAEVSTLSDPAVTAIGSDGYIVAWRREDTNASPRLRTIEAQRYTSNHDLSGPTISVDPTAGPGANLASGLDAATFGNGSSLISWVESQAFADNGDFIDFVVRGRVVRPNGSFVGDEFTISDSVEDQFATSALSLSNGDVLVILGEGRSTLRARLVSSDGTSNTLGAEFDLSQNVLANVYETLQTQTDRVIIGYNLPAGNSAITSEIISFCPVGCE